MDSPDPGADPGPRAVDRRDRLASGVGLSLVSMKGVALLALAWWLLR